MARTGSRRDDPFRRALPLALVASLGLFASGCRQDMHDQPRYGPMRESALFADGMTSRLPVAGTVARGQLREDARFYTGRDETGELVSALPVALDRELLLRGQTLYDAFCAACHGALGEGDGMVVQRGFRRPASLHEPRVREQPIGYYYDAISEGFGVMPRYSDRIPPADRWAIAAYLRALQLSQRAPWAELSDADRQHLPPPEPLLEPAPEPGSPEPIAEGEETLPPVGAPGVEPP